MFRRAALLAFVALQLALAAAAEEPCPTAGATRCDDDARVLSVCDAHGRWARVDCASLGGACLDGRCALLNATRDEGQRCTSAGSYHCNSDCTWVEICSAAGVYTNLKRCASGEYCDSDTYSCEEGDIAKKCLSDVRCYNPGLYPNLNSGECTSYYECPSTAAETNEVNAKVYSCGAGLEFDPCTRSCSTTFGGRCIHEYDYSSSDSHNYVDGNPALHYSTYKGVLYWMECASGYYNLESGMCIGSGKDCAGSGTSSSGGSNGSGSTGSGGGSTGSGGGSTGSGSGSCTCSGSAGRCSIDGTNCGFCFCTGATCERVDCSAGTHFVESDGTCFLGACT